MEFIAFAFRLGGATLALSPGMSRRGTPSPSGAQQIGSAIRRHRRMRGLSQRALAELAGVSQQMISGAERGRKRPALPLLKAIAQVLGVSVDQLLATVEGVAEQPTAFVSERDEWIALFDDLSAEARERALAFARLLRSEG